MMRVICDECEQIFGIDEDTENGTEIYCPYCGENLVLPEEDFEEDENDIEED